MLCYRCGSHVPDGSEACGTCGQKFSSGALRQATGTFSRKRVTGTAIEGAPYKPQDVVANRYTIKDAVGAGPLGYVFRAHDKEIDVEVALKVVSSRLVQTADERKAFSHAIRLGRKLSHNNLIRSYEDGEDQDRPFFTMQYLDGLTLRRIVDLRREKSQTFSLKEVEPIFGQICAGLDSAHRVGPHGGVKPENVIVLPDLLKLTDFGLALAVPRQPFAAAQRPRGGHRYLAPEYLAGHEVDRRADVYSLGVMLGEMLGGVFPEGGSVPELRSRAPELPVAVEALYRRAVNENPMSRFATAGEFFAELGQVVAGQARSAPARKPTSPGQRTTQTGPIPQPPKPPPAVSLEHDDEPTPSEPNPLGRGPQKPPPPPRDAGEKRPPPPPPDQREPAFVKPAGGPPPPPREAATDPAHADGHQTDEVRLPGDRKKKKAKGGLGLLLGLAAAGLIAGLGGAWVFLTFVRGKPTADHDQPKPPVTVAARPDAGAPPAVAAAPDAGAAEAAAKKSEEEAKLAEAAKKKAEEAARLKAAEEERRREEERKRKEALEAAFKNNPDGKDGKDGKDPGGKEPDKVAVVVEPDKKDPDKAPNDKKDTCPAGMRLIPAGTFKMGSSRDDPLMGFDEKALVTTTTEAYCIDVYEYPNKSGGTPQSGVSYAAADGACKGRNKRLCTEEEWEHACKGSGNARFPYGGTFDPDACNTEDSAGEDRKLATSGSFAKCRSFFGVADMSGNLAEWTSSPYNEGLPDKTVKGGAYDRPDYDTRCASRKNAAPGTKNDRFGFRCCADPQ